VAERLTCHHLGQDVAERLLFVRLDAFGEALNR
jgi:hypothetical protein